MTELLSKSLAGKTALVTGGNRGIGYGISHALAQAGCNVVVHCRAATPVALGVVEELKSKYGVKAALLTAELTDPKAIDAMFEAFDEQFKQLDILINNAGYENYLAAEDMPLEDWQNILQINLSAPFQCSQHAARRMKAAGKGGVIINISSIHDTIARKGISHYCCAKAGLKMLTKVTALEWAEYGIRVVTVSPGAIETDMNRDAIEGFGREKFNSWIPSGRVGNVEEIGAAVAFLCSNQAGYMTGTEMYIDGAYSINLVRYDDRPGRSELRSE